MHDIESKYTTSDPWLEDLPLQLGCRNSFHQKKGPMMPSQRLQIIIDMAANHLYIQYFGTQLLYFAKRVIRVGTDGGKWLITQIQAIDLAQESGKSVLSMYF